MRGARNAAAAFGFLTVLPIGRHWESSDRPDGIPWYPAVGWFLGAAGMALIAAARGLNAAADRNAWLLAVGVIGLWGLLTRFLHWDGLADSADGLLGAFEPERRLEIMRDSRVGAFGAVAITLVALAQVAAIGSLVSVGSWWPIMIAPVVGRAAVVVAAWTIPPARSEGLGLTVASTGVSLGTRAIPAFAVLAVLAPIALEYCLGGANWSIARVIAVLISADLAGLGIPRLLARGVGGVTGDIHGATVLLVETVVLVAGAVVAG